MRLPKLRLRQRYSLWRLKRMGIHEQVFAVLEWPLAVRSVAKPLGYCTAMELRHAAHGFGMKARALRRRGPVKPAAAVANEQLALELATLATVLEQHGERNWVVLVGRSPRAGMKLTPTYYLATAPTEGKGVRRKAAA